MGSFSSHSLRDTIRPGKTFGCEWCTKIDLLYDVTSLCMRLALWSRVEIAIHTAGKPVCCEGRRRHFPGERLRVVLTSSFFRCDPLLLVHNSFSLRFVKSPCPEDDVHKRNMTRISSYEHRRNIGQSTMLQSFGLKHSREPK